MFTRWTGIVTERRTTGHKDIFDVDLDSGVERRLTELEFILVTRPYFFPDSKRFVLTIESTEYPEHLVFLFDGKFVGSKDDLVPYFEYARYAAQPVLSRDGSVMLFTARTNEMDGDDSGIYKWDLFAKQGETITRLTQMKSSISDHILSFDGKQVIFKSAIGWGEGFRIPRSAHDYDMWIMNTDGTGHRKLSPPTQLPEPE